MVFCTSCCGNEFMQNINIEIFRTVKRLTNLRRRLTNFLMECRFRSARLHCSWRSANQDEVWLILVS
jgi:hypothetical protein